MKIKIYNVYKWFIVIYNYNPFLLNKLPYLQKKSQYIDKNSIFTTFYLSPLLLKILNQMYFYFII